MTLGITSTGATGNSVGKFGLGTVAKPKMDFEKILEGFKKAAYQTPAEKAREAVLAKHKLNEDSYQKLPSDEKKAIDTEIVEAVKQVTERRTGIELRDTPWETAKPLG